MVKARRVSWIPKCALLLAQVIILIISGCGPAPTPIIIQLPTATDSSSPITQPLASRTPATGDVTVTPPALEPGPVIKIFGNAPLSGEQAAFGQDIVQGASLAVRQLSGPLRASGYTVELVTFDDQNMLDPALANADAVVADPEILCGVGHYDSQITIAASNVYHQAGLAFVAPSATAALLTDRNYLEVNRVVGRIDGQGTAAAQFAHVQGYSSVYIIGQQAESSLMNAEYFRTVSGSLGIQWLGQEITDLRDDNRNRIVSQIMNANPDVVYISSSAGQAIPFLIELRTAGYKGALLGTEELDNPPTIDAAAASLVEGGGLFYTTTSPAPQYYPGAAQFVQDFSVYYGAPPLKYAARAYDATGICLRAIKEAAAAKAGGPPTRSEVARALRALRDYQGLTGTYDFDRRGDADPGRYFVIQVMSMAAESWDQNPIVAAFDVTPP
jgi:branched-chain amino acid transport system substrate-binding protein